MENTKVELKLEKFEGPLDLLLHLIEKNKVSIADIPIVEITDQYLEVIHSISEQKMEVMSAFLEMAATLLALKAKMLLPKPKAEKEEEERDPRQELMEQLLEYKKYKMISEKLRDYSREAEKSVYKSASIPPEIFEGMSVISPEEILADLDFQRLYQAFQLVMKRKEEIRDPLRADFSEIPKEVISLEKQMERILSRKSEGKIGFLSFFRQQSGKAAMVVAFLAILELMKVGEIRVVQGNLFDDIEIVFV